MERFSTVRRLAWITLLLVLSARGEAGAQMPPVVDPKTYHSASGKYELTVDPSTIYGSGGAKYQVKWNGKERWSDTLAFTLCDAAITNRGTVIGYGYTNSRGGFPTHPGGDGYGDFVVAILGDNGVVRLKESVKAKPIPIVDAFGCNPNALGLVVDEANDRAFVRVAAEEVGRSESWWVYRHCPRRPPPVGRISKRLFAEAKPQQQQAVPDKAEQPRRHVLAVRPIPGTPLTLVHFNRGVWTGLASTNGATFALVDLQGRLVWSFELPADYATSDQEKGHKLYELLAQGRGIVHSEEPRKFDLFFAGPSQRVSFSVTQSALGEWLVHETGRTPHTLSPLPEPTLLSLRKEALQADQTTVAPDTTSCRPVSDTRRSLFRIRRPGPNRVPASAGRRTARTCPRRSNGCCPPANRFENSGEGRVDVVGPDLGRRLSLRRRQQRAQCEGKMSGLLGRGRDRALRRISRLRLPTRQRSGWFLRR